MGCTWLSGASGVLPITVRTATTVAVNPSTGSKARANNDRGLGGQQMVTKDYRIGKAKDLGCDPDGGKWVIICRVHGLIWNAKTLESARFQSKTICADQCLAYDGIW